MSSRQLLLSSFWSQRSQSSEHLGVREEEEPSDPHAVPRRRSADPESASDQPCTKCPSPAADDYDVALAVGSMLDDSAKRRWVTSCERQNSSFAFPVREEYGYQRRDWLAQYPWLRFPVQQNGGYCLPCVLFGKGRDSDSRGQLSTSALTTFSRAASALRRHADKKSHCLAVTDQENFLAITDKGTEDVHQQLVSVDAQRRAENR